MKVSKITIGRLFNLGNYEHVRYELSVEVPEGESAATAVRGLENILAGLNPKQPRGVHRDDDIEAMEEELINIRAMADLDVEVRYGQSKLVALESRERRVALAKSITARWREIQKNARTLFDDMNGAEKFTDAKQNWEDQYDTEF
ncbi:MAG TPA: hypothetical protein VFU31_30470 [Candidatus Binatia bacterium]|nr:hypothetical protein [Candidatus Binatia bacterium]